MATAKDLRGLALALDGTTEAPHFNRAAFKVVRIYATLTADGRTANFKFTPDEQEFKCMMLPKGFAPVPNAWGRQGWTTGTLSKLTTADLKAALEMAWAHALPEQRAPGTEARARAGNRGRTACRTGNSERSASDQRDSAFVPLPAIITHRRKRKVTPHMGFILTAEPWLVT
jgi:hypothetical protein